ncbi:aconitase family protein [Limnohabitans sp. T6-20]|uniref:aconitase family protein n=1 Tax=Limnohabitans sp. T6-20 TaxID=1100725 RepID=UPI000D3C2452|nr:aconitase family protein [Limnohabitans sp. T6-20]PUE12632.1 3-isopropylmalate dehydratase [Limnohabitans sp. T6-20]
MNPTHWNVLYLSQDPNLIRRQLAGETLTREQAGPLRDDVSTDEITPVHILSHYDDRLGDFAHTGLRCGSDNPIGHKTLRQAGFQVLVAGRRYGKGSSREHSPTAEKLAGVQLVIAESFERIYRQNADNIGLFTSTDLDLLDRIARGEALTLADLVQGREALAASVLSAGGLLRWGQRFLAGVDSAAGATSYKEPLQPCGSEPLLANASHSHNTDSAAGAASYKEPLQPCGSEPLLANAGPQTLFEKILSRHRLTAPHTPVQPQPGDGLFVRADWRFIHEYYTGMADTLLRGALDEHFTLQRPEQIVVFEDHTSYVDESPAHVRGGLIANMHAMSRAQRDFAVHHGLRMHRTLTDAEVLQDDGRNVAGISHAMMAEHYALPGQVVVGTDSHTPHSGALGCVAFGVGTTDMANAFVTGAVRVTLPECVRVELQGQMPAGVTAKDLMLHLLATPFIRSGNGVGKVFEFAGEGIAHLSTDERATLTNMCAELGGLTGIVAPDAETVRFLKERRGVDFLLEDWMHSDEGAHCAHHMAVDLNTLCPMVARPGDPGQGLALSDLHERVRIDIAYGGSCTAGKREDFDHYHAVLAWGLAQGIKVPEGVQVFLQYGTTAVRDYCTAKGYDKTFAAMGVRILQPSCGACANCGPGSSTDAAQVTVSAINRNFPGRSGPGQVWLASPPTVMASALAGELISFEDLQRRVSG